MGKRARATGFLPFFLDDTPGRGSSATAAGEIHDVTNRSSTDGLGSSTDGPTNDFRLSTDSRGSVRDHPGLNTRSPTAPAMETALASRRDAPVVIPTVRGTRARRPTSELTASERVEAMAFYERDVLARSSAGSKESLWRTWCYFHQRWYGPNSEPVPATPHSLAVVVAQMKASGYQSVGNYVSALKDRHIAQEHLWDQNLAREVRRAVRSATRGRGSVKQAGELDLDQVVKACGNPGVLVDGGPAFPVRMIVFGCFFLLREVEISLMLARSVVVSSAVLEVSVHLPVSKTDPSALGCWRTW